MCIPLWPSASSRPRGSIARRAPRATGSSGCCAGAASAASAATLSPARPLVYNGTGMRPLHRVVSWLPRVVADARRAAPRARSAHGAYGATDTSAAGSRLGWRHSHRAKEKQGMLFGYGMKLGVKLLAHGRAKRGLRYLIVPVNYWRT